MIVSFRREGSYRTSDVSVPGSLESRASVPCDRIVSRRIGGADPGGALVCACSGDRTPSAPCPHYRACRHRGCPGGKDSPGCVAFVGPVPGRVQPGVAGCRSSDRPRSERGAAVAFDRHPWARFNRRNSPSLYSLPCWLRFWRRAIAISVSRG